MLKEQQKRKLNRPMSNSSTRLNSANDLKIEYVDQDELKKPARKLLLEICLKNKEPIKTPKKVKQVNTRSKRLIDTKPETTLVYQKSGLYNAKKYAIIEKLNETREKLPEKMMDKDKCKKHIINLKQKQKYEHDEIVKYTQNMKNDNKYKFDYYYKTGNSCYSSVLSSRVSSSNESSSKLLPKLLNSIRLTNFSNTYYEKKTPLTRSTNRSPDTISYLIDTYSNHSNKNSQFKNFKLNFIDEINSYDDFNSSYDNNS